jgi:hydroxymethylglutaryl-CoA reductase
MLERGKRWLSIGVSGAVTRLAGAGHAAALAEVAACLCLAGEISICAALSSGQFTRVQQNPARDRR